MWSMRPRICICSSIPERETKLSCERQSKLGSVQSERGLQKSLSCKGCQVLTIDTCFLFLTVPPGWPVFMYHLMPASIQMSQVKTWHRFLSPPASRRPPQCACSAFIDFSTTVIISFRRCASTNSGLVQMDTSWGFGHLGGIFIPIVNLLDSACHVTSDNHIAGESMGSSTNQWTLACAHILIAW